MSLKDVIKTENIIKVYSQETLCSALAKLRSSHDCVFIFSEDNKYLGVINPYYCLIKSSYPANAKVTHCLYHPPKVEINFPLAKVAQLFIESKIHYLPVFDDNGRFIGIISARRLLSQFKDDPRFRVKIEQILKKKKPLSVVYENDNIAVALNLFKSTKFSKLIVIDQGFKLKGILSYFDLIYYLMLPKESPGRGDKDKNKISFFHQQVKKFMKTYVLTLTKENLLSEALNLILTKKIGSVVILGEKKEPIGIITTRDLLRFFIQKEREIEGPPVLGRFFKKNFLQDKIELR